MKNAPLNKTIKLCDYAVLLFTLTFFYLGNVSFAQITVQPSTKGLDFLQINEQTSPDSIKQFLKLYNASEIEFNSDLRSPYCIRLKQKNNWVLLSKKWEWNDNKLYIDEYGDTLGFGDDEFMGYECIKIKDASFAFPDSLLANHFPNLVISIHKNKKYLTSLGNEKFTNQTWFDSMKIMVKKEFYEVFDFEGDSLTLYSFDRVDYIQLCRDNKWAMAYIYNDSLFQLTGFHFKENQLPDSLVDNYVSYIPNRDEIAFRTKLAEETIKVLKELPNVDLIYPLWEINQSLQLFQVRDSETKRWSIVLPNNTLPAPHKKSIEYENSYLQYLGLWNNQPVKWNSDEITNQQSNNSVEMIIVNLDYMEALAIKEHQLWSLYDLESTKLLIDQKAKTIDLLIDLWLNRN